jgi:phytoene synthase
LFAPADRRSALFALYGFNAEIARIRDVVSEPLAGEVRMQWWRELLDGEARGDSTAHPVAAALLEAIAQYRLPRQALANCIDARVHDLYDDPFPTIGDLEGYCGETSSAIIRLATLILAGRNSGPPDAAGHAGVAYAITGLLRALPFQAARGQVFLPAETMERHGVAREDILAGRATPALLAALAELRQHARRHVAAYRSFAPAVPPAARPAFLPVALVEPTLSIMDRVGYQPFQGVVELAQWRRQWALWRAARQAG